MCNCADDLAKKVLMRSADEVGSLAHEVQPQLAKRMSEGNYVLNGRKTDLVPALRSGKQSRPLE